MEKAVVIISNDSNEDNIDTLNSYLSKGWKVKMISQLRGFTGRSLVILEKIENSGTHAIASGENNDIFNLPDCFKGKNKI